MGIKEAALYYSQLHGPPNDINRIWETFRRPGMFGIHFNILPRFCRVKYVARFVNRDW